MLLGISSYTYGWSVGVEGTMPAKPMNELDLVKQTLAFGLKCIQIGDNLPVHLFSDLRKKHLKKQIEDSGMRLELGARKLTAENLSIYLELCRFFNAPLLRFVIDGDSYEPEIKEVVSIVKEFLPELIKSKVTLGIENHDRFKVEELAGIMEAIDHEQVGICLDCVNSVGAGEGLVYVADILAPYTVNLHIKDFKTRRLPHKMGFIVDGEIAGQGMTNLLWLLEKVNAFGRCQSAILEQWVPPETDIGDTCRKEKQWAEKGISYVKQVLPQI